MSLTPLSKLPHFDPRLVPVLKIDAELAAISPHQLASEALRQRFATPPSWTPELVQEVRFSDRQLTAAAVLIPLIRRGGHGGELSVLLTERTAHLSSHSGQIAFPGGKTDETDASAQATALREAQEEVGLDPRFVQVIGNLPLYTTGSGFVITPVVALVEPDFELRPNPHEVADVFEVPLAFLMNPANHHRHAFQAEGVSREWYSMPYYQAQPTEKGQEPQAIERFIWGATAGMLRNFYRFLSA